MLLMATATTIMVNCGNSWRYMEIHGNFQRNARKSKPKPTNQQKTEYPLKFDINVSIGKCLVWLNQAKGFTAK